MIRLKRSFTKFLSIVFVSSFTLSPSLLFAKTRNKTVENFSRLGESTALAWDQNTIRAFCRLENDFVVKGVLNAYKRGRKAHCVQLRALLINELSKRGIKNDKEHQLIKKFFHGVSKKAEHSWATHQCAVMLLKYGKNH
ncbi:MAG: hypothetical protein P1V97_37715, partial [Planctomycetota bacterium]|nr:hypothetical protein [Planctomycetota bacterium]